MRRFHLQRHEDATGVSGIGRVAEGVVFSNGRVAITWLTEYTSIAVYDSMDAVRVIHGHDGRTEVVYEDG